MDAIVAKTKRYDETAGREKIGDIYLGWSSNALLVFHDLTPFIELLACTRLFQRIMSRNQINIYWFIKCPAGKSFHRQTSSV